MPDRVVGVKRAHFVLGNSEKSLTQARFPCFTDKDHEALSKSVADTDLWYMKLGATQICKEKSGARFKGDQNFVKSRKWPLLFYLNKER